MNKMLLSIMLFLLMAANVAASDEILEKQLNSGIKSSEAYAGFLIKQAEQNKAEAARLLDKARHYSPELPAVYFKLAQTNLPPPEAGLLKRIDNVIRGINVYPKNFWWSFTLAGAVCFSLVLSFLLSYVSILAIRMPSDIPLITHDIKESSSRVGFLVLLLAFSVISPLLFIAGCLVLIGIYMKKTDQLVIYIFLVFLGFSGSLANTASVFVNAGSMGKLKAVVQSNESKGNTYALTDLKDTKDFATMFSNALALKNEGYYQEAIDNYSKISESKSDPRVLVNQGNCFVGLYNFEEDKKNNLNEALKYYSMAINIKPTAAAYYNLSEVSRELLNFEKGDEYFKAALALDGAAVERYRSISSRHPNRFVMDETLSTDELWEYARISSLHLIRFGMTVFPVNILALVALILIPVLFLLPKQLRYIAYRCRKCNSILCSRCDRELVVGQICSQCYGSMIKLAELDVKERVARILSIYDQQKKRRDNKKILSFILPGAAQIYSGKILYGFLILWPFMFLISFPFVSTFFFPASSIIYHGFISGIAFSSALLIYLVSNILTRQGIAKGWL